MGSPRVRYRKGKECDKETLTLVRLHWRKLNVVDTDADTYSILSIFDFGIHWPDMSTLELHRIGKDSNRQTDRYMKELFGEFPSYDNLRCEHLISQQARYFSKNFT